MSDLERVNPDLVKERNNASFDVKELSEVIYDGGENLKKKRLIEEKVYSDPDYKSVPFVFLSKEEQYAEGMRKIALAVTKKDQLNGLIDNDDDFLGYVNRVLQPNVITSLGYGMFLPTIKGQGTPEQQEKWLPLTYDHKIIGTYAQTEMGHGTFLRGLETTAHYDPHTQEFVLNSPTTTSIKWWPGALGKTSTHAVVMAQLYTMGKCFGVHPFMVQLRSLEDHRSMPGVTVGDIGPKFGYTTSDNGYLKLNNCRIPRMNMLMKYSKVAPNGEYSRPPQAKLTYGTMTYVRSLIVKGGAIALAQGCTIAVRYSCVRHQSEMRPGEPEPQILDYPTQQHKIFPLLATAYAFHFVQITMMEMYHKVNKLSFQGDFSRNQELHALSSGLKAFTSYVANAGLETLRMSCGGHGYSCASGFPQLYTNYTPSCTYEGENTVLMLQCARYLVKCVGNLKSGSTLPGSVSYLQVIHNPIKTPSHVRDLTDYDVISSAYQQRALGQISFVCNKVDEAVKNGMDLVAALNSVSVHLVRAAYAHSHYFVVHNFIEHTRNLNISQALKEVMNQLVLLYALEGISTFSGEFLEDGILTSNEVKLVRQLSVDLLPKIRVNAVALVDAFDFRDEALDSVLGRYDGNVYENLFKWAQNSALNKTDVHPSYGKYLAPLLKRNQSKL